jgi:hypothetical protein
VRPRRAHPSQLCEVRGGDPGDEPDDLPQTGHGQLPAHHRAGVGRRRAGEARERAEGLRRTGYPVGTAQRTHPLRGRHEHPVKVFPQRHEGLPRRRVTPQPLSGEPPGAQRDGLGQLRLLVDPAGDLQRAAADVEHDQATCAPTEPAADSQEGDPGLIGAGQHLQVDAGLVTHPVEDLRTIARLSQRRRGEGEQIAATEFARGSARRSDGVDQRVRPAPGQPAGAVDVLGQPQHGLLRVRRTGVTAAVGVHDEQVDSVGSDVEHSESHVDLRAAGGRDPLDWSRTSAPSHSPASRRDRSRFRCPAGAPARPTRSTPPRAHPYSQARPSI